MKIVSINSLKDDEKVAVSLFGLPYETLTVRDFKLNDIYNSLEDFKVVLKDNKNVKVSVRNSDMDKYKNLLSYLKKNRKIKAEDLRIMEEVDDIDLSQLNAFHWEYIEERKPIKDIKGNLVAEIVIRNTIKNIHKEKGHLVSLDIVMDEFLNDNLEDDSYDDSYDEVFEEMFGDDTSEEEFEYISDEDLDQNYEEQQNLFNEGYYYMIELIKEVEFNVINNHEIIASDSMYSMSEVFLDDLDSLCDFLNGNIGGIKVTMGVEANSKERVIEDISNKNINYIWED